jgi:integrase
VSEDEIKVHVVQEKDRANLTMRYRDPVTGQQVKRSAGTPKRKEAQKRAAKWEAEINEGRYQRPQTITWDDFRDRFEREKLASPKISEATRGAYATALNHLERIINPDRLCKVTTETFSRFVRELRKPQTITRNERQILLPPMKESTIACHLRHLKAAMNWAVRLGLLLTVPVFDMPDAGESKGRPLAAEEFERLLAVVPKVRPHDPGVWTRHLYGLWLSGLRLEESLILSWNDNAAFSVDLSGKYPVFNIEAKAQKGRRTEKVPMTPDFATWLLETPQEDREGPVFKLAGLLDGKPLTPRRASRIISKFGEKAGIVVNREVKLVSEPVLDPKTDEPTGKAHLVEKEVAKFASAHDLRRSFGSRWAKRLMPAVLQKIMRHANITTTMRYYVDLDANDVASDLWKGFGGQEGTVLGTMAIEAAQETAKGSRQ